MTPEELEDKVTDLAEENQYLTDELKLAQDELKDLKSTSEVSNALLAEFLYHMDKHPHHSTRRLEDTLRDVQETARQAGLRYLSEERPSTDYRRAIRFGRAGTTLEFRLVKEPPPRLRNQFLG